MPRGKKKPLRVIDLLALFYSIVKSGEVLFDSHDFSFGIQKAMFGMSFELYEVNNYTDFITYLKESLMPLNSST